MLSQRAYNPYLYTNVESVDETDVIEVLSSGAIQGEFYESRWWFTSRACAFQLVSTVASFAVTVAIAVKRAPSSNPETTCPTLVCRYSYLKNICIKSFSLCDLRNQGDQDKNQQLDQSRPCESVIQSPAIVVSRLSLSRRFARVKVLCV